MITVTGTVGSSGKYLVTGIPVDTQGDQQISGVAESVDDLNATFSKGTPCITRMALRQEDRRRKIVLP